MGVTQVKKLPFFNHRTQPFPMGSRKRKRRDRLPLRAYLVRPFVSLDSVVYKGNMAVWKRDTMQLDKAIYTANMREKNTSQKELILDGDSIKEYGNTPPNRVSYHVDNFYRYRNKPQLYIHTKFKRKEPLLYI